MWAYNASNDIKGSIYVGHPVPYSLVNSVFQSATSTRNRPDFGAKQLHAEYVHRLTTYVLLTHVNHTFLAEHGAHCGNCDAMLPCTSLSDYSLLAHPGRQQCLT